MHPGSFQSSLGPRVTEPLTPNTELGLTAGQPAERGSYPSTRSYSVSHPLSEAAPGQPPDPDLDS